MKKIYLYTLTLCTLLITNAMYAQNARVQWINNSPSDQCDTVDVYVDGTKIIDNLNFRAASSLISMASGTATININQYLSVDSGDLVISRHTLTTQAGSNSVVMIVGVDTPANYAANPTGRDISMRLVQRKGFLLSTSTSSSSAISFFHGAPDASGVNITTRPAGSAINVSKLKFWDTTGTLTPNAVETYLDVKDTTGTTILASFLLPLNQYGKKALTVFASGFMNPSANMNGPAFKMYAVDTNGGNATALNEVSRIQFIHNAPDVTLDSVDIWIDNTKQVNKLGFARASVTYTVTSAAHDITITKKGSADTSAANQLIQVSGYTFVTGTTYLAMTTGVKDTNLYKTNPEGLDRSLGLRIFNNHAEASGVTNQTRLLYINGTPDAGQLTLQRTPSAPVTLFSNISYNNTPGAVTLGATTNPHILLESTAGNIIKSYRLPLAGQGNKSGVLFTAGHTDTVGNPTGSKAKNYYVAYSDGTQAMLNSLNGKLQVIHASADPALRYVKLFMDGKIWKDSFAFRHATSAVPLVAYKNYRVHLTALSNTDTSTSLYAFGITPDSAKLYYAIGTGLTNTAGYAANPDGVDRSFTVVINGNGREKAQGNVKNVDLMYFHSVTDMQATTSRGIGQILYLSKNNMYKGFHGYNAQSAFDNVRYELNDAITGSLLFTGLGNLTKGKGLAGIVVASGFLNPSANNNGDSAMMFAYWPDGLADSMPSPYTGLNDLNILESSVQVFPNPASDRVELTLDSRTASEVTLAILDVTGKEMIKQNGKLSAGFNKIEFNTSALPAGMYLIHATCGDQRLTRKLNILR